MAARKLFPKDSVCKPCWELKYCPYGPLVEYFPGPRGEMTLDQVRGDYNETLSRLASGECKTEEDIWSEIEALHYMRPGLWEQLAEYEPEDVGCKIFGHTCPVFFCQSGATETISGRPEGRYIPREVMLKVVRRDNHLCQLCFTYVPDDQIEFDHLIPFSKGGATTVENLRLLCRTCNQKKADALHELLRR